MEICSFHHSRLTELRKAIKVNLVWAVDKTRVVGNCQACAHQENTAVGGRIGVMGLD